MCQGCRAHRPTHADGERRERFDNRSFYGDGTHNIAHSAARRLLVFCSNCCSSHYANDGVGSTFVHVYKYKQGYASCFFVHAWCAHAARVLHFSAPHTHSSEREKKMRKIYPDAKGHPKIHRAAQNASRESFTQMSGAEQTLKKSKIVVY